MSSAASHNNEPPPPNPILTAYEGFVQNTPWVTRSIVSMQVVTYLLSWFYNPYQALANIPHFILTNPLEVYRLLLSPLVNTSLFSVIFAVLSFSDHGKRLEQSMGSTRFAVLCLSISVLTNTVFFLVCMLLHAVHPNGAHLFHSASSVWIILFGVLSVDCVKAGPSSPPRRFFFTTVPVLYYPVALLLLISLLSTGSSPLGYIISMAIGYAYGFGRLERIEVTSGKASEWESSNNNLLGNLVRRHGWISSPAAIGSGAWSQQDGAASDGMGLGLFQSMMRRDDGGSSSSATPVGAAMGSAETTTGSSSTMPSSFSSGGRTLGSGGTARRGTATSTAEARAARLQALERRSAPTEPTSP